VITGATGFVGSNLTKYLIDKNEFEIHLIIRSNSNLENIDSFKELVNIFTYDGELNKLLLFFKKINPDTVFHLASNFIAEHESSDIDTLIDSNITFGLHILEAMKVSNTKKLINTGTSWQHYKNEGYNPVCLYAATKQAFESLIEYYSQAESFKVITLKLFDTYGENDKRLKLINLLNKYADDGTILKMSPGEQILNLVHVDDVCNAFYIASKNIVDKHYVGANNYTVSNPESYKLKDLILLFENVSGKKIKVIWGGRPYRNREVMRLWDKGQKLPNWNASISLKKGLKKY
jgi:nucleoside-diphosphate-sugar epimerase